MLTAIRPSPQAQLADDPAHGQWLDLQLADDLQAFDDWLQTPKGQQWLDTELEIDDDRQCRADWKGW